MGQISMKIMPLPGSLLGGNQHYGIERFYRDVRLFRIYEGTTQIQQLVIARGMIKEASL